MLIALIATIGARINHSLASRFFCLGLGYKKVYFLEVKFTALAFKSCVINKLT